MTPLIRVGWIADIDAVLRLWILAGSEPTHTDDAPSLGALVGHVGSSLLVAEEQGEVVGTVIAGWDGWRGSVYRLAVTPSHRRRGLGGQLVAAAETHLRAAGAVRLGAIVVETESEATGFWRSGEWEEQRHRLRFVKG
jgi:ribosomal protein S18 acetylase RimI-like enzyme